MLRALAGFCCALLLAASGPLAWAQHAPSPVSSSSAPDQAPPTADRDTRKEVVSSHPHVLDDPGPNVTFEAFADSTLNIVVRAFLSSMDIRLATIHDLHVAFHKKLGEAGIEIAFPQRDIHIRGIEKAILPRIDASNREAA